MNWQDASNSKGKSVKDYIVYDEPRRASSDVEPRITVYIASKNYGRYLSAAIESVLRQTVQDWELLVIDDGSTDETVEVMNLYRGHPQIGLYTTPSIGLPSVCNFAVEQSHGRYLIRLDGDDLFDENILLILGNALDRDPDIALVFPDYFLMDDNGAVFSQESRARLYQGDHMLDMPPNGACTLIRRSVFSEIGPYRVDLGAQDGFDLWTRIRNRYKTANVNLPLFFYRRHGQNLTTQENRIQVARRQIKKDVASAQLDKLRPLIAVIPCRRNYDFVTDLWSEQLDGRMLLERDIGTCMRSDLFDHIVVSCDNPAAQEVLAAFDDPRLRFHSRSPESTIRTASIVSTLEQITEEVDPQCLGTTVQRFIQTPFVTTDTLEEAIATIAYAEADSAIALEEINNPLYRRTAYGMEEVNRPHSLTRERETVYREVNTCLGSRNRNFKRGSLRGASVASFTVSSAESFFISSAQELEIARLMVQANRNGA